MDTVIFIVIIFMVLCTPFFISVIFRRFKLKYIFVSYFLLYMYYLLISGFVSMGVYLGMGILETNEILSESVFISNVKTFIFDNVKCIWDFILFLPLVLQLISNKLILGKVY